MIKLLLLFSLFLYEPQIVEVKIKGMVCSFCAQGLQKGIGKLEEVEKVEINVVAMDQKDRTAVMEKARKKAREKT
mgnify:CR=1 FL=1